MADILRRDFQTRPSDDIGDVLTSIRRLIAQDTPPTIPTNQPSKAEDAQAGLPQAEPNLAPVPLPRRNASAPLVLTRDELVAEQSSSDSEQPSPATAQDSDIENKIFKDDEPMLHNTPQTGPDLHSHQHLASQPRFTPQEGALLDPMPLERQENLCQDLNLFTARQDELPNGQPLQGLIRDVIIREMEGELGSRMTRNLRQLIRSEISQALQEATRAG